ILYSTHLGNTDCLVRTVCDMAWAASPRLQQGTASRLYATLLVGLAVFSLAALHLGSVQRLLEILGLVACPITALSAIQILRVNTRFLPREIQPPLWRKFALLIVSLTYGGITAGIIYQWLARRS